MTDRARRRRLPGTPRRLIDAAQQGDREAQHELLRRYEPLVQRVVWKLRLPQYLEREDFAQEARIGLVAAMRAWRPERGPFPAFADRCVSNQALLALQAACRHKHQLLSLAVSLEAEQVGHPKHDDGRVPLRFVDTLPSPSDPLTDPESRLLVHEELKSMVDALPALTKSERTALVGLLAGNSYEQLALIIGGTPKAASQAAYRARRKLAAALPRAA
jgi:RNA polymerase sigma factor (sigma-70 family)